jgi:hypothetical protein
MYGIAYIYGDAESDFINFNLKITHEVSSVEFPRLFEDAALALGYAIAILDFKPPWLLKASETKGYLCVFERLKKFNRINIVVRSEENESDFSKKLGIKTFYV